MAQGTAWGFSWRVCIYFIWALVGGGKGGGPRKERGRRLWPGCKIKRFKKRERADLLTIATIFSAPPLSVTFSLLIVLSSPNCAFFITFYFYSALSDSFQNIAWKTSTWFLKESLFSSGNSWVGSPFSIFLLAFCSSNHQLEWPNYSLLRTIWLL